MNPPPAKLAGAGVLRWAALGDGVTATGGCAHTVNGVPVGPAATLAVCVYPGSAREFYLFRCDPDWRVLADTCHATLGGAEEQAEFEYAGVAGCWRAGRDYPPANPAPASAGPITVTPG